MAKACILTSARKGYFQFTLLNQLGNFYSNYLKTQFIFIVCFTIWKLPVPLDANWSASVNFVPREKSIRHWNLHLCRCMPKMIRIKKARKRCLSSHTLQVLTHLRDTNIKLLFGAAKLSPTVVWAIVHSRVAKSSTHWWQRESPWWLHQAPDEKSLDFTAPESPGCVWADAATRNSSGVLHWSSAEEADSPPSMEIKWADSLYFTPAADPQL